MVCRNFASMKDAAEWYMKRMLRARKNTVNLSIMLKECKRKSTGGGTKSVENLGAFKKLLTSSVISFVNKQSDVA